MYLSQDIIYIIKYNKFFFFKKKMSILFEMEKNFSLNLVNFGVNSVPSLERGCCCFLPCQSCHVILSLFVNFIMQLPVCLPLSCFHFSPPMRVG
jgi:hypothetical protein